MSSYDIVFADGVTSFPVYALEQDGPDNLSIPRQVIRAIISGGPGVNRFEFGDDLTYRFVPGFQFQIIVIDPLASPVTANIGTYTVVPGGSTFDGTTTSVPVVETIPRGFFTIVGVSIGPKIWTISGNHAAEFGVNTQIIISSNTGGADGTYTVVSAADVGPNTNIVVSQTIPGTATVTGSLSINTHSITARTTGAGGTWTIAGEVADRFPTGTSFNVNNVGTPPATSGFQIVDVGGAQTAASPTSLIALTTYTATVSVDGGAPQPISILGSTALTYGQLLTQLNNDTTGATWTLPGGNLRCTSNTTGLLSTVAITAGTLFAAPLAGFVAVNAATPGTVGNGDGTYSVATAVNGVGTTVITVTGTIPPATPAPGPTSAILVGNLPLGHLQYTVSAADGGINTSLLLPGRGSPNWGQMLEQNQVRTLENFNSTTPPAAPIQGQQWYNTGVGLFLYASTPPINIVGVNSGTSTWTAAGDLTPLLIPGDNFVVFGDSGMPFSSLVYQVQSITFVGPDTDIVIEPVPLLTSPFKNIATTISALAVGDGQLYIATDYHQLATSRFPMTEDLDMGNFILNNTQEINAAKNGAHIVDVGGTKTGSSATGLANDLTVYTASIIVDGGASQPIAVTGNTAQTYTTLISQLQADTTGATWSLYNGNIRVLSDTTGLTSTIKITDVDLFSSLTGFVTLLGDGETLTLRGSSGDTGGNLIGRAGTGMTGLGGSVDIRSGGGVTGGSLNIRAGAGTTLGNGGSVDIRSGNGGTGGGDFFARAGNATVAGNVGGSFYVNAGNGNDTGPGGGIQMDAGSTSTGSAGNIIMNAGSASTVTGNGLGGNINLQAGDSHDNSAGSINIGAGSASGVGADGSVTLSTVAGTYQIALTGTGELSINSNPGTTGQVLTSGGPLVPPTWSVATASLSNISAAIADKTINNGAFNIVWNWQLTTDEVGFLIGETLASTGGTTNQVLFEVATIQSSTASAFRAQRGAVTMIETQNDGDLILTGGTNAAGGRVLITGGISSGIGIGGAVTITSGTPTDGNGGIITLLGANGIGTSRNGGNIVLTAGNGNSSGFAFGGNIQIKGGEGGPSSGEGGGVTITGGRGGATTGTAGTVTLKGGPGGSTSGDGGSALVAGGNPVDGNGGQVFITGANGTGTNRIGGSISITGGSGTGTQNGGDITLTSGAAGATGPGSQITLSCGSVTAGNGGAFNVFAGNGAGTDQNGGIITLTAGNGRGTGIGGDVSLVAGTTNGTTGTRGNITQETFGGYIKTQAGNFSTAGDARSNEYILRTATTTGATTEMFLDGTAGARRMVLPNDTTWKFDVHVVARRADANDESAGYQYGGVIDRNASAATTALVGTVQQIMTPQEDTAAWAVTITADTTNGSLKIEVTGEAAKTIRWVAFVRTVEVTG